MLGGAEGLEVIVLNFYDKVVKDNRIGHFFKGIDMLK